jgi:beta-lactamase class D
MVTTSGSGLFKSKSEEDLWTSTAVPGYALYKRLAAVSGIRPQMMQALEQAGADGFFVKMTAAGKDYSMTMSLMHAEEKSNPASLFEIPAGYTKTDENMMQHMMATAMASQASKKK